MAASSDIETAERIQRRRARVIPLLALLFLSGQAIYFGAVADAPRAVDHVKISAWLAWAAALLLLLATGGGLFRSRSVRALLNDESTSAHRAAAIAFGFWAVMLCALLLYVVTMFEAMSAREAIHLMLTAGVGAALLRFAMLERRSLRGG